MYQRYCPTRVRTQTPRIQTPSHSDTPHGGTPSISFMENCDACEPSTIAFELQLFSKTYLKYCAHLCVSLNSKHAIKNERLNKICILEGFCNSAYAFVRQRFLIALALPMCTSGVRSQHPCYPTLNQSLPPETVFGLDR